MHVTDRDKAVRSVDWVSSGTCQSRIARRWAGGPDRFDLQAKYSYVLRFF